MKNELWHELHTQYGCIRLDENAYKHYLSGDIQLQGICIQSNPNAQLQFSEQVLKLREQAEKHGAYTTLRELIPGGTIRIPYKLHMHTIRIEEMNLSVRASNGLMRAGVFTLGEVQELIGKPNGLRTLRNLGAKSEREIIVAFFSLCYQKLEQTEKNKFWQNVLTKKNSRAADD